MFIDNDSDAAVFSNDLALRKREMSRPKAIDFRLRRFGAELRAVKARIERRPQPPTQEEVEIALIALLALSGPLRSSPTA